MSLESAAAPPSSSSSNTAVIALAWLVRAVPLMAVGLIVGLVVPGLPWWVGVLVGAILALVRVLMVLRSAASWLLAALGATPAEESAHARYLNLVQGLSLAGGSGEPDVYVVESPGRNAAAVANGDTTAVVATTGLLDSVDRIGLEAVVAEAVVRIGNGDASASTVGAALLSPMLGGPLAPLTAPPARAGLTRLLGADRDLSADRGAVALTRYPPGLLGALGAVREGSATIDTVPATLDHIWFVPPPSVGESMGSPEFTPLDLRIDVLGEL
ncbi:MAG: hypothetical protein AAGD35_16515 [Actinomycetota bacterium]